MSEETQPRAPRRSLLFAVTATLALAPLALLLFSSPAQATYDPIGGGATKLTLDSGFLKLLKNNKVKLKGTESARVKGKTVTFPASGGMVDPTTSKGTVNHSGALLFKTAKKTVPLNDLLLKTAQVHSPLSAKLGGGQLKLASAKSLSTTREGFGLKVKVTTMKLSAKVAVRLDKRLHLKNVFKAGQPLGSSVTTVNPTTVAIQGTGKASLALNPETLAKLNELFVAVNPIFPAEHPGPFTLPIFGGTIAPDASIGTMETNGSLELIQLMGGQVFLREPWAELATKTLSAEVDAEPSPPYSGKQGRVAIAALNLAGAAISANPGARTITLEGATATMQAGFAETLNEVFAKPKGKGEAFKAGDPLGTLSFVAQGQ